MMGTEPTKTRRRLLAWLDRTVFCCVGAHGRCDGYVYGKGGFDSAPCPCPCHTRREER